MCLSFVSRFTIPSSLCILKPQSSEKRKCLLETNSLGKISDSNGCEATVSISTRDTHAHFA